MTQRDISDIFEQGSSPLISQRTGERMHSSTRGGQSFFSVGKFTVDRMAELYSPHIGQAINNGQAECDKYFSGPFLLSSEQHFLCCPKRRSVGVSSMAKWLHFLLQSQEGRRSGHSARVRRMRRVY